MRPLTIVVLILGPLGAISGCKPLDNEMNDLNNNRRGAQQLRRRRTLGTEVEVSRAKADAPMSDLIEFYRGLSPDSEGRMLTDLWAYSDDEMEEVHDFIQWMFPLREPSRFNTDAPLVTDSDVEVFQADPALRASLLRSFERFLAFLGLAIEGGRVVEGAGFALKREVWRYPNHNWLRISRVLASLRMLGLEDESRAFFDFLGSLRDGGTSGIDGRTFGFWSGAAGVR